jgi:hypothetical protein
VLQAVFVVPLIPSLTLVLVLVLKLISGLESGAFRLGLGS